MSLGRIRKYDRKERWAGYQRAHGHGWRRSKGSGSDAARDAQALSPWQRLLIIALGVSQLTKQTKQTTQLRRRTH